MPRDTSKAHAVYLLVGNFALDLSDANGPEMFSMSLGRGGDSVEGLLRKSSMTVENVIDDDM